MKLIFFLWLLSNVFVLQLSETSDIKHIQQWHDRFEQSIGWQFKTLNDRFQKLIRVIPESKVSIGCRLALNAYFRNPFQEEWSLKMWDSNGHFPSGILAGTFFEQGNFDECLLIKSDTDNINGKYCILETKLPENRSITISNETRHKHWTELINIIYKWDYITGIDNGICLPSTCNDEEINQIIPQVFIPSDLNLRVRTKLCQDRTTQTVNLPLRFGEKIVLTILLVHILLVFSGTILSESMNQKNRTSNSSQLIQLLLCFSLTENTRTLFKTNQDHKISVSTNKQSSNNQRVQLKFIYGLRVLSIYWILLAHVFLFYPFSNFDVRVLPARSLNKIFQMINNLFTHFIVNAGLAVETFFLISGALTVYTIFLSKKNGPVNIINYVFLRWFRFSPSILGAMCLLILWPRIGEGPLFHPRYINYITEPCYHNWWLSFIYLANLYPSDQVCNVMHWYLSADFQLHILLYVVIYFFYKRRIISMLYIVLMIMLGFCIPIAVVLLDWAEAPNPSIFLHPNHQLPMDKIEVFIFATYNHLIPYFIGVLLGLVLIRKKPLEIPLLGRCLIWIILFPLFMMLPFASYSFVNTTEPVNAPLQSAITFGIVRLIWSMGIFWLCWECSKQRAGLIQKFLEADIFQPFSRLSFAIYLVHIIPIWNYLFTIRSPIEISMYNLLFIGIGNAVLSTLLAYLLYCFFERPYAKMIKMFFLSNDLDRKRSSSPGPVVRDHQFEHQVVSLK